MIKIITLKLLGFLAIVAGQTAWNTGDISFNYGSPIPDQTVELSGDFLSNEIPNQGVGGVAFSLGDSNIVSCIGYDIHITEGDTLADIFAIFLQDSAEIEPGYHVVGLNAGAIKLFVWLQDVDPEVVVGLIDTSFNLDSLSMLNAYVSLSGQIEIEELNDSTISGNFAGAMMNTGLDFMLVTDGVFAASNTLPELAYSNGSLDVVTDSGSVSFNGPLNPLQNDMGVGAVTNQIGDTLSTNLFGYMQEEDGTLTVYGMMFQAHTSEYPVPGMEAEFPIGFGNSSFAMPYVLTSASLDQVLYFLDSDSIPSLEDFENLYLPVIGENAILGYNLDETAYATLPGTLVANFSGDSFTLSEIWMLSNYTLPLATDSPSQNPKSQSLVGAAYPNPFNGNVIIPFEISESTQIDLIIYNMLGQKLNSRTIGAYQPGSYQYNLSMDQMLPGGLYYFSLRTSASLIGNGSFIYLK